MAAFVASANCNANETDFPGARLPLAVTSEVFCRGAQAILGGSRQMGRPQKDSLIRRGFIRIFGDNDLAERLHAAHLLSLAKLLGGPLGCHRRVLPFTVRRCVSDRTTLYLGNRKRRAKADRGQEYFAIATRPY